MRPKSLGPSHFDVICGTNMAFLPLTSFHVHFGLETFVLPWLWTTHSLDLCSPSGLLWNHLFGETNDQRRRYSSDQTAMLLFQFSKMQCVVDFGRTINIRDTSGQREWNKGNLSVSARSTTHDESFKLCNFKDDPKPLGGLIRSKDKKTILCKSLLPFCISRFHNQRHSLLRIHVFSTEKAKRIRIQFYFHIFWMNPPWAGDAYIHVCNCLSTGNYRKKTFRFLDPFLVLFYCSCISDKFEQLWTHGHYQCERESSGRAQMRRHPVRLGLCHLLSRHQTHPEPAQLPARLVRSRFVTCSISVCSANCFQIQHSAVESNVDATVTPLSEKKTPLPTITATKPSQPSSYI